MDYLQITFFIFILFLFLTILDHKLSLWIFKEKRKKLSDTDVERIYLHVRIIITLIMIVGFTVILANTNTEDKFLFLVFLVSIIILMYSFQTYMEWRFFEKSKQFIIPLILMVICLLGVTGIYYMDDRMNYTTFPKVTSKLLNDETVVKTIKIHKNDDGIYNSINSKTIEDEKLIERIRDDLSKIELKKAEFDYEIEQNIKYVVEIITTNQVGEKHYSTEILTIKLDENHLITDDYYDIISETDHLETIKLLLN